MSEIINHEEAEHLAIMKQGESNLARCYLEHAKRIAELEAALKPFAAISGVAVPRRPLPPEQDRLWGYYDSRAEKQHEITRAHVDEAARVLADR